MAEGNSSTGTLIDSVMTRGEGRSASFSSLNVCIGQTLGAAKLAKLKRELLGDGGSKGGGGGGVIALRVFMLTPACCLKKN